MTKPADPGEISRILRAGDVEGEPYLEELIPLVYGNLRAMAARHMAGERRGHTLEPTALVHEAWLKLEAASSRPWTNRGQFYAAAARAMRQILVDHARARSRRKRGGGRIRIDVDLTQIVSGGEFETLVAVEEAACRLEEIDPRAGSIVHLRLFAGLGLAEAAVVLGIPLRTVERDWAYAKAWLYERLT